MLLKVLVMKLISLNVHFRYFVDKKPIWDENPKLVLPRTMEVDSSVAQYTGGSLLVSFMFNICCI